MRASGALQEERAIGMGRESPTVAQSDRRPLGVQDACRMYALQGTQLLAAVCVRPMPVGPEAMAEIEAGTLPGLSGKRGAD